MSTRPAAPEVVGGLGGFGGAFSIPAGYREPLMMASTDGVGTKTVIAAAVGRFDTIGIDLVAMCADDVVCTGAEPLAFLDYVAVGLLDPVGVAELVGGVARRLSRGRCALVGGETAEHPGLCEADEFDLAGMLHRRRRASRVIDGRAVVAGDVDPGPRLVRTARQRLLARARVDRPVGPGPRRAVPGAPAPDARRRRDGRCDRGGAARDAGDARRGAAHPDPDLRAGRAGGAGAAVDAGHDLHGLAHITGGGLPGNVPRALPDGLGARLDPARWPMPSVMRLFGALGGLEDDELRATFNGGLGMIAVVCPPAAAPARPSRRSPSTASSAAIVGEVRAGSRSAGARYAGGALESIA